jgi:hypothetical protein
LSAADERSVDFGAIAALKDKYLFLLLKIEYTVHIE